MGGDTLKPDMECSYWPDGIPTWLGGNGHEWLDCCRVHDLSEQTAAAAFELGKCVSSSGHAWIALVMVGGLLIFGPAYLALKRLRKA